MPNKPFPTLSLAALAAVSLMAALAAISGYAVAAQEDTGPNEESHPTSLVGLDSQALESRSVCVEAPASAVHAAVRKAIKDGREGELVAVGGMAFVRPDAVLSVLPTEYEDCD